MIDSVKHILRTFFIVLFAVCMIYALRHGNVYAQFIHDEDSGDYGADKDDSSRSSDVPSHCAYNIKSEVLPNIRHAIKVTWDVDPAYEDDFLVGRLNEPIDTERKALDAKFIAMIPPKSTNIVIDERLFPGKYYYVVLSRKKVQKKDIELFRDQNYTTYPAEIEYKPKAAGDLEGIRARKIDLRKILVSWNRIKDDRIIYTLYRSSVEIKNDSAMDAAEKIATITDGERYIDESLLRNGPYYYAITTKIFGAEEKRIFEPDQTYTTFAVYISDDETLPVHNLHASRDGNSVKLNWDKILPKIDKVIKEFTIHRAGNIIDNFARLDSAQRLGTVDGNITNFVDMNPGSGRYYYAVSTKYVDGSEDWRLQANFNYTTLPIEIEGTYSVRSIDARLLKKKIEVTWSYNGSTGERIFRLFRVMSKIKKFDELNEDDIISKVDIEKGIYIDEKPQFGLYYYGLAPLPGQADRDFRFVDGVNITAAPVEYKKPSDDDMIPGRFKSTGPDYSSVDKILKHTFFVGKYLQAIKELQYLVEYSDNLAEIAKARLFLGRSYIEIKSYNRALDFLVLPDVREYYSKEARFWADFSIARIRKQ